MQELRFYIRVNKHKDLSEINGTLVVVRVADRYPRSTYGKAVSFMDEDVTAKANAFDSLLRMITEAGGTHE